LSLGVCGKLADIDPFAHLKDALAPIPRHPAGRLKEPIPRQRKTRFDPQASPAAPAAFETPAGPPSLRQTAGRPEYRRVLALRPPGAVEPSRCRRRWRECGTTPEAGR